MSKKIMLLALAAVSAALFAMPAVASAGTWDISPTNATFSIDGTTAQLTTANRTVHCTSSTGNGSYTSATTGNIELTFSGCTSLGTKCWTNPPFKESEQKITTTEMVFHNVELENNVPGIQITGNGAAQHMASFKCGFGLVTVVVSGNVLGEVTKPLCGAAATSVGEVVFATNETGQRWKQITTTGTSYDETATVNGTPETGAQVGSGTITFAQNVTSTCT
jgi:hypothetical protein